MEGVQYKLVRVLGRTNKEGRTYFLAYVVLNSQTDCSLINILITAEQKEKLLKVINDNNFDIGKHIVIEYNSYQKQYQPKIKI